MTIRELYEEAIKRDALDWEIGVGDNGADYLSPADRCEFGGYYEDRNVRTNEGYYETRCVKVKDYVWIYGAEDSPNQI